MWAIFLIFGHVWATAAPTFSGTRPYPTRTTSSGSRTCSRVGYGLVPEKVGAAVDEDRETLQLLGDGTQRRGVAARGDSTKEVDLLRQLQPAELLDVGVGSRGLVSLEDRDLSLAAEAARGL